MKSRPRAQLAKLDVVDRIVLADAAGVWKRMDVEIESHHLTRGIRVGRLV